MFDRRIVLRAPAGVRPGSTHLSKPVEKRIFSRTVDQNRSQIFIFSGLACAAN